MSDTINQELARKVAQRLTDQFEDQFSDILGGAVQDVLSEEGFDQEGDQYFERLMDVASRIYIGSN